MTAGETSETSELAGRRHDQVFTPSAVAEFTLRLVLDELPSNCRILDPACGDGSFLRAALSLGVSPESLAGIEIDEQVASLAMRSCGGVAVHAEDFLTVPCENFDAVVGNPPYIRAESLSAAEKDAIADCLRADWPALPARLRTTLTGRADLAATFVLRALRYTNPGGSVAFVLSQAMLDSDYGQELLCFVSDVATIRGIIVGPSSRWFSDADVRGTILLLKQERQRKHISTIYRMRNEPGERPPILGLHDLAMESDTVELRDLSRFSVRSGLRAPVRWSRFMTQHGSKFARLRELAGVRRGVTTGANEFFYVSPATALKYRIEPQFLRPIFRTRESTSPQIELGTLQSSVFVCQLDRQMLSGFPGAKRYIEENEARFSGRRTLSVRKRWWQLDPTMASIFLGKAYDSRFVQYVSDVPLSADQRVYEVLPHEHGDGEVLAATLNSFVTAMVLEYLGRASMGQGALEWSVADAKEMPVLNVAQIASPRQIGHVGAKFARIRERPVQSVLQELNRPDRLEFEAAVFDCLGVKEETWRPLLSDFTKTIELRVAKRPPALRD